MPDKGGPDLTCERFSKKFKNVLALHARVVFGGIEFCEMI